MNETIAFVELTERPRGLRPTLRFPDGVSREAQRATLIAVRDRVRRKRGQRGLFTIQPIANEDAHADGEDALQGRVLIDADGILTLELPASSAYPEDLMASKAELALLAVLPTA